MKPILEHLPKAPEESFVVKNFSYKYYPTPWHFHPEYEIVLVSESSGKRFIGDNISSFKTGDLALLGSGLPHLYRNDAEYYTKSSKLRARSIVIHFLETAFGEDFLKLPEANKIRHLLARSQRGLEITGKTNKIVMQQLEEIVSLQGFARLLKLFEILLVLSESRDLRHISGGRVLGGNEKESQRIDNVLKFVITNFGNDISLADAARVANMAENSFSRFFKQSTRKTFSAYLNELRLNHSAKLLIESDKTILDICYECGFNNLSNFHRFFKLMHHSTPLQYRKLYWDKIKKD